MPVAVGAAVEGVEAVLAGLCEAGGARVQAQDHFAADAVVEGCGGIGAFDHARDVVTIQDGGVTVGLEESVGLKESVGAGGFTEAEVDAGFTGAIEAVGTVGFTGAVEGATFAGATGAVVDAAHLGATVALDASASTATHTGGTMAIRSTQAMGMYTTIRTTTPITTTHTGISGGHTACLAGCRTTNAQCGKQRS